MTQNQIKFAELKETKRHNYMTEVVDMGKLSEQARANSIQAWHYGTVDPAAALKDFALADKAWAETQSIDVKREHEVSEIESKTDENKSKSDLNKAQKDTERTKQDLNQAQADYYSQKPQLEKDLANISGQWHARGAFINGVSTFGGAFIKYSMAI